MTSIEQVEVLIKQRRLRWLRHLQRMENNRIPKKLLPARMQGGKKTQGGQKLRWNDVIGKDLEELNMLQTWKQKALNRNEWRNEIFKIVKEKNTEAFLIQYQHPGCIFLEKNKGGLANYVRQTHQAPIHMTCPHCNKQFKKQGLPNHLKKCFRLFN